MIKIEVITDSPKKRLETVYEVAISKITDKTVENITNLAAKAVDAVRHYIETSKKREGGTGKLERAIDYEVEKTSNGVVVGIGNIDKLNQEAPYWFVVNYGRRFDTGEEFIPHPNLGFFEKEPYKPTAGTDETSMWIHTGRSKDFLLTPKKFTPLHYIEYLQNFSIRGINEILTRIK